MSTNTNTGANARAKVLDPRSPMLAQPFKRLVEEGFILELTVKFTPSGFTAMGKPDQRMVDVKDSGLTLGSETSAGILAAVAEKGNLAPKGKKSKSKVESGPPLPKKSLCKKDFEGSQEELFARAQAVAQECNGATLVGRVRSHGAFDGSSTISFQKWWSTANTNQRLISLTLKKYFLELGNEDKLKIREMPCPFRGTAEFTVSSEEDEEDDAKGKASFQRPEPTSGNGSGKGSPSRN